MAIYQYLEDRSPSQEEQDFFNNASYINKKGEIMAGILYERYLYSMYRDLQLVPAGFSPPAPGGHGKDFEIFVNNYNVMMPTNSLVQFNGTGINIGVECKLSEEDDYGQSGVRYDGNWVLHGKMDKTSMEKRSLLKAAGVEQVIRNAYAGKGIPNIRSGVPSTQVTEEKRQQDKRRFRSFDYFSNSFVNLCAKYYISKQCHYINISSLGLYHFGVDPAGLARAYGVKNFCTAISEMGVRVRLKQSGKNSLTYNVAMKINTEKTVTKSPVNLNDRIFSEELQEDALKCSNAPSDLKLLRELLL